jgi:hypothetical protein
MKLPNENIYTKLFCKNKIPKSGIIYWKSVIFMSKCALIIRKKMLWITVLLMKK